MSPDRLEKIKDSFDPVHPGFAPEFDNPEWILSSIDWLVAEVECLRDWRNDPDEQTTYWRNYVADLKGEIKRLQDVIDADAHKP